MKKEIVAGLSTFFTAAYLILLYPKILSEGGIDFGAALTATIATMALSTLFLGFYADFPALLAPGLSVGPFLVYSIILKQHASWQTALGLVFWSGLTLFILSLFKIRQKILLHLPQGIKSAAIGGIGLFLIGIGLKNLGFPNGELFTLPNGIALFGLLLFLALRFFEIASSFLIVILACWILSLFFHLSAWEGLIALPPSLLPSFFQLNLLSSIQFEWMGALVSIVLISLFDTSGGISVLSKMAGRTDEKGNIKEIDRIVIPDGAGTMVGAFLGTGPLTFTLESSAGIQAGGRGKITAVTVSICCLAGLFLYPLISSIPLFAVTPAMVGIGIFMAGEAKSIRWKHPTESIPALITLLTIPLTFSIYLGFAFGFLSYSLLKGLKGEWREVHPVCWILTLIFGLHLSWALATHQI